LIENMRREGYELAVSPPQVVMSKDKSGKVLEPIEEVHIDCPSRDATSVIEKLALRKADLKDYNQTGGDRAKLKFLIPTRGLIGFRAEFANDTRGEGIFNHIFHSYAPHCGPIERTQKGAIICVADGVTTGYALHDLQPRGILFVEPGTRVYRGMVVGEHSKGGDVEVNPTRQKALTNVRSVMKEDKRYLTPPKIMSVEEIIAYMRDDEIMEVTKDNVRLRKRILDVDVRRKLGRGK